MMLNSTAAKGIGRRDFDHVGIMVGQTSIMRQPCGQQLAPPAKSSETPRAGWCHAKRLTSASPAEQPTKCHSQGMESVHGTSDKIKAVFQPTIRIP